MYKLSKKGGRFTKIDTPKAKGEAAIKEFDEKVAELQGEIAELTARLEAAGKYAENADSQIAELTARLEAASGPKQ